MEEADRVADKIAIIDRGRIIASGTSSGLKKRARKKSLEEAFLKFTGHHIREEEYSSAESMRMRRRIWHR